ncbi:MAG: terpene cyclase/mutase family protein [Gammaproteobacteria bacterium]|nr:terpene cyclase/mutase family protein [Gammaproteobacteria bacterium]
MQRIIAACLTLLVVLPTLAADQPIVDRTLAIDAIKHTDYGLHYLRGTQAKDGSWSNSVAVTALALRAFLNSYQRYTEEDGAFITRPVDFLLAHVHDDGSIGESDADRVATTALAITALQATRNPRHADVIANAQAFLRGVQANERRWVAATDARYGGIGDAGGPPALWRQYLASDALRLTALDPTDPLWSQSVIFVSRRQNPGDGSFGAFPRDAGDPATPSAPLTVAALVSLLHAGVANTDPRVAAARQWLDRHFADQSPPGLDRPSELFAYLDATAKALRALGDPVVGGANGQLWRDVLIRRVLALYQPDGAWGDGAPGHGAGGDPALATALAVDTLNEIIHSFR